MSCSVSRVAQLCVIAACSAAEVGAHSAQQQWMDPTLPVAQRVEALLAQMTVTDKLWQLRRPDWDNTLPETGVGILEFPAFDSKSLNATQVVQKRNAAQRLFLNTGPGARLGIPAAFRLFSIHGAEAFGTTFPEGPGLGATWNADLVTSVGTAIATEGRALGADMFLPVINLWSDPRFGRQQEGFSEDPTLTASFAAAFVQGCHGALGLPIDAYLNDTTGTIPTFFKHVGAYGVAAGGMNGGRADVPEHTVREVYLRQFRRAAVSGTRGVMPSHNSVLNTPAHASTWLLRDRLRTEYNMSKGLFISDTGDVLALRQFRLCGSDASCAALAINAGVDVEQVPGQTFLSLPQAIEEGLTTQALVDDAVRHVLTHKFAVRLFDQPYTNESLAQAVVNSPQHVALAQTAVEEGIVLLVNRPAASSSACIGYAYPGDACAAGVGATPILPLPTGQQLKIAVVGPNGGCGQAGNGAGNNPLCEAQLSMLGNYAEGAYVPNPFAVDGGLPTVAQALAQTINASGYLASVAYARGCNINDADASLIPAAATLAQASDVTIAVVGDSTKSCGEGMDRDDLDLPGGQIQLLQALVATGKPLVVVLIHCRTASFGAASGNALMANFSALLTAWRPGQAGGAALARVLLGQVNPSGRLPMSWIRTAGQANGPASPWLQERVSLFGGPSFGSEGRTYSSYVQSANAATPMFPFGYGLSYTSFVYSGLAVAVQLANQSYPLLVTLTVSNTGPVSGRSVVQVYVQDPVGVGLVIRPWKRLLAFAKTGEIQANGGQATVSIPVRADDLALVRDDYVLAVVQGNYTLSIGHDSVADTCQGCVKTFTIPQGQGYAPGLWP